MQSRPFTNNPIVTGSRGFTWEDKNKPNLELVKEDPDMLWAGFTFGTNQDGEPRVFHALLTAGEVSQIGHLILWEEHPDEDRFVPRSQYTIEHVLLLRAEDRVEGGRLQAIDIAESCLVKFNCHPAPLSEEVSGWKY